jgi:hypothetical protein
MTGPDDAFLAPDDALRDFDEDPGADDVERPGSTVPPREDEVEDAERSAGSVEGDPAGG